jgi:hypothetical protein
MSSSFIAWASFTIKQMAIYFNIPVFIIGTTGACLNIIIFLSLKTFRQSSCAFYLMMMSIFDIGRFFGSVVGYIVRWGFGTDWGATSFFYCEIKLGLFHTFTLCSMTCLCLAIIDQYFATSSRLRWQQWSNIKLAYRLTTIFCVIWILHGIPYLIFNNQIIALSTNQTQCVVTNDIFNQYLSYGYCITLTNLIPLITIVFGLLAFYNARHLAHRTVPLVRRELDKQLTVMVLVQVLISVCFLVPFSTFNVLNILNKLPNDLISQVEENLAGTTVTNLFVLSFAVRIL